MMKMCKLQYAVLLLALVILASCSSKPETADDAKQYVVGKWRSVENVELVGKRTAELDIKADGTYTATLQYRDDAPEVVERGSWTIDSFADYAGSGKPVTDTYQIVMKPSNPDNAVKSGALRSGEIQTNYANYKRAR